MKKLLRLTKVKTTCDGCGRAGLVVFVPKNEDGSIAGREFPSLCSVCEGAGEVVERTLKRFAQAEGVEELDVDGASHSWG